MASKYGFAQGLKELRFLFCQTSEHSAATRYAIHSKSSPRLQDDGAWHSGCGREGLQKNFLLTMHRNFLTKSYPTMKKHNPHTPIMLREASGIEPKVYARYGTSTIDG
jgi:hypothetical protein